MNLIAAATALFLLASSILVDAKTIRHKTSKHVSAGTKSRPSGTKRQGSTSSIRGLKSSEPRRSLQGSLLEDEEDTGIIGGTSASAGEFPFFVKFEGNTLCGGSLISPDTVLTAAHCVDGGRPNQVRIGSDLYDSGGYVAQTQCAVSHPDFIENSQTLLNDVAIVKLKEPITDPSVSVIAFNTDTTFPSVQGTGLTVIGFGITSNGGSVSNTLQKLSTSFETMDKCMAVYSSQVVNPENHICADVANAGGKSDTPSHRSMLPCATVC